MRVATFNLWGRSLVSEVAALCRDEQLDLLYLQEVDRHYRARSEWEDVPRLAAEALGWNYAFAAAIAQPGADRPGEYGNAILTPHPIYSRREYPLARDIAWTKPEDSLTEPRVLLEVIVGLTGGVLLRALCTHLADVTEPDDEWVGLRQVEDILRVLRDPAWTAVPTVLAGDLNARVGSRTLAALEQVLTLVPAHDATVDHVLISDTLGGAKARLLAGRGSDHQPVLCEIDD
jgi:endonuclease/exonuclease/phosphatase family metal-dependent hydrolase